MLWKFWEISASELLRRSLYLLHPIGVFLICMRMRSSFWCFKSSSITFSTGVRADFCYSNLRMIYWFSWWIYFCSNSQAIYLFERRSLYLSLAIKLNEGARDKWFVKGIYSTWECDGEFRCVKLFDISIDSASPSLWCADGLYPSLSCWGEIWLLTKWLPLFTASLTT